MIPAHFTKIDTIPVKSNGKMDRNALPKPEIQNIEGISTNSIGSENNRRVVMFLDDSKPSAETEA